MTGAIGAGQTSAGGNDGYLVKLDAKGKTVYEQQFGTSGNDTVAATALTASGDLVVASVQNGEAILSKYAGGDATSAPVWQMDLGALQNGGSLSGLAVSGNQIYLAGSTQNAALTRAARDDRQCQLGRQRRLRLQRHRQRRERQRRTRSAMSAPSGIDKAGGLAVGSDGTVYLTGTTNGTFAGQNRNVAGMNNHVRHGAGQRRLGRLDAPIWRRRRPVERSGHRHRRQRFKRARRARPAARHRRRQPVDRSDLGRRRCARAIRSRSRFRAPRRAPSPSPSTRARRCNRW